MLLLVVSANRMVPAGSALGNGAPWPLHLVVASALNMVATDSVLGNGAPRPLHLEEDVTSTTKIARWKVPTASSTMAKAIVTAKRMIVRVERATMLVAWRGNPKNNNTFSALYLLTYTTL